MSGANQRRKPDQEVTGIDHAITLLLTPIVRLFIRFRITFPRVMAELERLYIKEAARSGKLHNPRKKVTKSQIALSTGINSRQIAKHLSTAVANSPADRSIEAPEAKILELWASDPKFSDRSSNRPLDIPIYGSKLSFQSLVKRSSVGSISYAALLDTFITTGNVEVLPGGERCRLVNPIFEFRNADADVKLQAISRSLGRLGSTLDHNTSGQEPRRFQQEIWSDFIPIQQLQVVRSETKTLLEKQHEQAIQLLSKHEKQNSKEELANCGIGYYYFEVKNYIEGCGSG